MTKILPETADAIRARRAAGASVQDLARDFRVSASSVRAVLARRRRLDTTRVITRRLTPEEFAALSVEEQIAYSTGRLAL